MTKKWLLCAPDYFNVEYEINPWMSLSVTPNQKLATEQWSKLYKLMLLAGADCSLVNQVRGWPDMVFTANAGLVKGSKVMVASFRHKERQGETPFFKNWFDANGFESFLLESGSFEGEGDALFAGETLFCGFGFRSDRNVFNKVADILEVQDLVFCELINPSFYHLDTCFCPINNQEALCVVEAFTQESIKNMEAKINLIPLTKNDASCFGCNSVIINNSIIIPSGCSELPEILASKHFTVYETPMSEFIKAGGAAKCLSLRLDRDS